MLDIPSVETRGILRFWKILFPKIQDEDEEEDDEEEHEEEDEGEDEQDDEQEDEEEDDNEEHGGDEDSNSEGQEDDAGGGGGDEISAEQEIFKVMQEMREVMRKQAAVTQTIQVFKHICFFNKRCKIKIFKFAGLNHWKN